MRSRSLRFGFVIMALYSEKYIPGLIILYSVCICDKNQKVVKESSDGQI